MSQYEVSIDIDNTSLRDMRTSGFEMFALKGVSIDVRNARPVVWFTHARYGLRNTVQWSKSYQAYTAENKDDDDAPVDSYNPENIKLGQQLQILEESGAGKVVTGPSGMISVHNILKQKFRAGLAERPSLGGGFSPLCVFPIFADSTVQFWPVEQIALFFSTRIMDQGAVLTKAFTGGVRIDLTGVQRREVKFSTSKGWHGWPDGAPWAKPISSQNDLVELLVHKPGYAAQGVDMLAADAGQRALVETGSHAG